MSFAIRPYVASDRATLHALAREPSLVSEFGWLLDNGELEDPERHPFGSVLGPWLADGVQGVAGFAMLLRFESAPDPWTLLRLGVREPFRRRGLGRTLAEHAITALEAAGIRPRERLTVSHWDPSPGAAGFARALGFAPERFFWTMERPGRSVPAPDWPAGLERRVFDGSDGAFRDWSECSNAAFAANAMSPRSSVEQRRKLAAAPHFDRSGLLLVYRKKHCVGFCQCAVHLDHGDVDGVGVVPEARGIGLGRALLLWGVAWLLDHQAPNVRLPVDGENHSALRLYQSQGFAVIRTRAIWARALTSGTG